MKKFFRLFTSIVLVGLPFACLGALYELRTNYAALNVAALLPDPTSSTVTTSSLIPYPVGEYASVAALKSGASFAASIPSDTFDVDERGLPRSPMLFQICYFDGTEQNPPLVRVYSRIEFVSDDPRVFPDKREMHVATFRGAKSGVWKSGWYTFGKTPFQLIRAIDGMFTFRIQNGGADPLPIAFVELRAVSEEAYRYFLASKRAGITYVPNPLDVSMDELSERATMEEVEDVFVFTRDLMHPVYQNTRPKRSELCERLIASSTLGEVEAMNFALYSSQGIDGLSIAVSDLNNRAKRAVIVASCVSVFKVVYDERRLSPNTYSAYGLLPDRLEPFDILEVPAGTSQRIWIKIAVPEDLPGGDYEGAITIGKDGALLKNIGITLTVVPVRLDPPHHLNPVYVDPFSKTYAGKLQSIIAFLREVGFDPFYILGADQAQIVRAADGSIWDFNLSRFEANLQTLKEQGCLKRAMIVEIPAWRMVYQAIHGTSASPVDPDLYLKLSDERFKSALGLLIREVRSVTRAMDVKTIFSLLDEPGDDPYKRIIADRLAWIIKENGGSTTATYYDSCDRPVPVSSNVGIPGNIIPPLTDLVDYKVWYYQLQGWGFRKGYTHFGYYTTFISHLRNPAHNRFAHGLYAFATSACVVSSYALGDFIGDLFNDLDSSPEDAWPTSYPDFLMGYPTWDGRFIAAMNSEGVREGITDARYLATVLRLAQSYRNHPASEEALRFIASLKERVSSDYWSRYYTGIHSDELYRLYHPQRIFADVSDAGDPFDYEAFAKVRSRLAGFLKQYLPADPILSVAARSEQSIVLSWRQPSSESAGITRLVLEKSSGGLFAPIAELPLPSASYEDKSVVEGRRYWYRLRAINDAGSVYSRAIRVSVK